MKKLISLILIAIIPACSAVPKIIMGADSDTVVTEPFPSGTPVKIFSTPVPTPTNSPEPVIPESDKTEKRITNIIIFRLTDSGKKIILGNSNGVLQNSSRYILAGMTDQISAEIYYSDDSKSADVEFISNNPEILQVDKNGRVSAKSHVGSNYDVAITARARDKKEIFTSVIYKVLTSQPITTSIYGKVFDINNNIVQGAKVNAIDFENNEWGSGDVLTNSNGEFVIKNVPPDTKLSLNAGKDGFTSNSRIITARLIILNEVNTNVFNFGGTNSAEKKFAIQNEPEITEIKINNKLINLPGAGNNDISLPESDTITPNNNFEPIVEIKVTFNEPVKKDLFEDVFRIVSQKFPVKDDSNFILSKESGFLKFEWIDEKTVKINPLKPLLQEINNEARYKIEFSGPFRDLNGLDAIKDRYIKFNPDIIHDYVVFSVKNDNQAPQLDSVRIYDGGPSNKDKIILRYSELLEVLGNSAYSLLLKDPENSEDEDSQEIVKITVNGQLSNNVTLFGYDPSMSPNLMVTYAIGKLDKDKKLLVPLTGIIDSNSFNVISDSNTVTLEFNSNVFEKSDVIVFSPGTSINGEYVIDNEEYDLTTVINYPFADITDPAGNTLTGDKLKIITIE